MADEIVLQEDVGGFVAGEVVTTEQADALGVQPDGTVDQTLTNADLEQRVEGPPPSPSEPVVEQAVGGMFLTCPDDPSIQAQVGLPLSREVFEETDFRGQRALCPCGQLHTWSKADVTYVEAQG